MGKNAIQRSPVAFLPVKEGPLPRRRRLVARLANRSVVTELGFVRGVGLHHPGLGRLA